MIVPVRDPNEQLSLIAYLASKCGTTPGALVGQMPFELVAVWQRGKPCGAMLFNNFRTFSVEMTAAGEVGWLTLDTIRFMFSYPFEQLGVQNLLLMCQRDNAKARDIVKRLGFREMCALENGQGAGRDTIMYAMARGRCAWLSQKRVRNGQKCTEAA